MENIKYTLGNGKKKCNIGIVIKGGLLAGELFSNNLEY